MHVAIDARIALYNASGLRRYLDGLLEALAGEDLDSILLTLMQSWRDRAELGGGLRAARRSLFTPPHNRFERFLLSRELSGFRADLLHCIDFYSPVDSIPLLLTVHDLYFLRQPESLDSVSRRHYERVLTYAQRAAHVVCISESTRADLCAAAGIPYEKVSVIYPGFFPTASLVNESEDRALTQLLGAVPITLAVGTLEPRKNYLSMVTAYLEAFKRCRAKTPPLVIVGRRGYRAGEIEQCLREAGALAPVYYLGEVSEATLGALYRRAKVLLFASKYEGFGFPLLEAMASNTVVVTSNNSAMAEVSEDAALLADPDDPQSIKEALVRAFEDTEEAERLIRRGRKRAAEFSWKRCAAQHVALYRELGASA